MANLDHRVRKLEEEENRLTGGLDQKAFFFRSDPEVPGEAEIEFHEENPDFKGEVYIYSVGTENLTQPV